MDNIPQLAKPAFDTDYVAYMPEAARIILGHVTGRSAGQIVGGIPASGPETPDQNSSDNSTDENFQEGWGPMPGDQEPDD